MRVIMSCAGTGGHIYPAIAIADKIKAENPDAEIIFIGTKRGMENTLVPKAGYEVKGIDSSGFDRKNLLKNFKTVADIVRGSAQAKRIIRDFKPDMAIGTGGYVTGVVIKNAAKMGVPCYIHEQNAVLGMANKLLEKYTKKVFISFEESRSALQFPDKAILTGNPIRKEFLKLDPAECRQTQGLAAGETMVLAFGGSLGAEMLNKSVIRLIDQLPDSGVKLYFVTGKRYFDEISSQLKDKPGMKNVTLVPYADNMPELILASDVVISRAGAIAVSEITASGRASVLIPSPNVTNNHQYHNAKAIADAGAAVLLEEKDLGEDFGELARIVKELAADPAKRSAMEKAAKEVGRSNAVDIIYENLKE